MRAIIVFLLGMAVLWHGSFARADRVRWEVADGGNGHYYMRLAQPMGWHEAKRQCEQLGGHLATVTSPAENRFVYQSFAQHHVCWLGATDEAKEGEWRWVTGEPFDYQAWFSGEPNNEGGAENFLVMGNTSSITDGGQRYYYRFGMRWNDHDEPGTYRRRLIAFPVCEWEEAPPAMHTAGEDRRGIATHVQSSVLPVTDTDGSKLPLHTFCLDADGYLLAGVGGENLEEAPGEVRKFDPHGKYLATWSVPVKPEAMGIGPDGSIYVGGSGQLIKLNAAGEVVLERDAPHIRSLKENSDKIRDQIIAQAERQKEMLAKQIETYEKRIAAIEEKDEGDRTERDEKMLKSYRRTIERNRDAAARYPRLSKDQIEKRVQSTINRKQKVSSISAAAGDVYAACPGAVGYGFDIWRLDEDFEDAKQIATGLRGCCGQMEVVRTLLDFGAGVDFADNRGVTPLHEAASQGHGIIVALLLANGADPNFKDRQRRTPMQVAVQGGHQNVADLLREHGAK